LASHASEATRVVVRQGSLLMPEPRLTHTFLFKKASARRTPLHFSYITDHLRLPNFFAGIQHLFPNRKPSTNGAKHLKQTIGNTKTDGSKPALPLQPTLP